MTINIFEQTKIVYNVNLSQLQTNMISQLFKPWLATIFFLLVVSHVQAQPITSIPSLPEAASIDGEIDEAVWQKATRVDIDVIYRPFENIPSSLESYALVYENGEKLFVAFVFADDDPESIRARFRARDNGIGDDAAGIKIDPQGDGRLSYNFWINPYGIQTDYLYNEITRKRNREWDAIWYSAAKITDKGFQAEVALPLSIMNFSASSEPQTWGISFERIIPRKDKLFIGTLPRSRSNQCETCQFEKYSGFQNANPSDNLFIVPSVVLGQNETRDVYESRDWDSENIFEPGVDVKWSITPEVSLQATLNPDFSQVEADDAQLSINNNFALFFPEKRPFFLENQEYFNTQMNLVYTRNIQSPDYGVKVAGNKNGHTFGLFVVDDASTVFFVPGNLGSSVAEILEPSTNMVGRYRYDFDNGLSLGLVATDRQSDHYQNAVQSADLKYEWNTFNSLTAQIATSSTDYPIDLYRDFCGDSACLDPAEYSEAAMRVKRDDTLQGNSWKFFYNHTRRDWFVRLIGMGAEADFRADMGVEPEVDRTKYIGGGGYNWYSEQSWWNKIELYSDFDITHNKAGDVLEQEGEARVTVEALYQSKFTVGVEDRQRRGLRQDPSSLLVEGNATLYDEYDVYFKGEISPSENFVLKLDYTQSDKIDYANDRLGEANIFMPSVEWRWGQHFLMNLTYNRTVLEADQQRVFSADLTDLRLTYQFDKLHSLKLVAINSDIKRNQTNYVNEVDARSTNLAMQLLYSYTINPLTKYYVGYSEASFSDDVFMSNIKTNKSLFMKFSYAWQP